MSKARNVDIGRTSSALGFGGSHVGNIDRDGAGAGNVTNKVRPQGVVPQGTGPTFTCNDPVVGKTFGQSRGKTEGKFKTGAGAHAETGGSTVVTEKEGPTITCNDTPILQPSADIGPPLTKQIAEENSVFRLLETAGELTATQSGSGGPADHPYFLAKSYDKKGKKSSVGTHVKPFEGA